MRLSILNYVFFLSIIALAIGSCTDADKEEVNQKKKIENTTWSSTEFNSHTTDIYSDDYKSNTSVISKMQQMNGLRYTSMTQYDTLDVTTNLCKKSGHEYDYLMKLNFLSEACNILISKSQSVYKATKITEKVIYKFEEGNYIVNVGGSNYEGINVYSYGIYRANGTLFIALDGYGCSTIETKTKYIDKHIDNDNLEEKNIQANYSISQNLITISYNEGKDVIKFDAELNEDENTITLNTNPFTSQINNLEKQ